MATKRKASKKAGKKKAAAPKKKLAAPKKKVGKKKAGKAGATVVRTPQKN